jgi:hypothetical protein
MAFDPTACFARSVWCGKAAMPNQPKDDTIYTAVGTPYQCMQKGFGAGMSSERKKSLPVGSLQHIKFIGPTHEACFGRNGIQDQQALLAFARSKSTPKIKRMLSKCLTNKNGTVDRRAFNSVALFLYTKQIRNTPDCL